MQQARLARMMPCAGEGVAVSVFDVASSGSVTERSRAGSARVQGHQASVRLLESLLSGLEGECALTVSGARSG
ncbi:MAG: hypothetical protein M2R45_02949 [Verrucomicrobia subdivision 3 bacterium]|nr:hypothetical protein [Limisphaerales bacterium]MCS1415331.1 hypothetical protein [Limisphaerales bacterium]